jgi:hypothetical protein
LIFWSLFLNSSPNKISCLKRRLRQKQKNHWPY